MPQYIRSTGVMHGTNRLGDVSVQWCRTKVEHGLWLRRGLGTTGNPG